MRKTGNKWALDRGFYYRLNRNSDGANVRTDGQLTCRCRFAPKSLISLKKLILNFNINRRGIESPAHLTFLKLFSFFYVIILFPCSFHSRYFRRPRSSRNLCVFQLCCMHWQYLTGRVNLMRSMVMFYGHVTFCFVLNIVFNDLSFKVWYFSTFACNFWRPSLREINWFHL